MTNPEHEELAAASVGALAGSALPIPPPGGALVGAVVSAAARQALVRLRRRQRDRVYCLLNLAARHARITIAELDERLAQRPDGEALLIRTLRAATETGSAQKLLLLASCVAGAVTTADPVVTFEVQLARAAADLDMDHFLALRYYVRTARELGLRHAEENLDEPVINLSQAELDIAMSPVSPAVIDSLMAGLDRHGLIDAVTTAMGEGRYGGRREDGGLRPSGRKRWNAWKRSGMSLRHRLVRPDDL